VSAVIDVTVPDLGDFHDVPVIEVLIKSGETIAQDAPLVTLESEKASMEVPASHGGVVRDVKVRVGDRVSTGSVLASVEVADEAATPAPSAPTATAPSAPAGASQPMTSPPPAPAATAEKAPAPSDGQPTAAVHASPAIRRFARELGVDLAGVSGSGPNGRVTRDDVQSYVKGALTAAHGQGQAGLAAGIALPPWPVVDFAKYGPIERLPLSRIKRLSGPNVHRNWVMIPHVTQNDDADVTGLEEFRKQLNAEQKDVKVTMLAFLMKAAVAALRRYPEFNASLDGDELVLKRYYSIGFAADTPGGLVVPVVRDVERKGLLEIARETSELAAKARDGKLGMNDMQGGTFTISSLGGIGGTSFTPIVNAPEVAILGVTRAATRPVWDGATFVPRLILPLSLSYDHRVIDGAAAARFCTYLAALLADMRRTLL
jgi:pyruvate dehydrogenase E2 component (dihydrolipoamide acetyltransferase)